MSDNESDELRREGAAAGRRADAYLDTLARIEQDITMIDNGAAAASIAISLKRIADSLDALPDQISNVLFGYWHQTHR